MAQPPSGPADETKFARAAYAALLTAWILLFAFEAAGIGRWAAALSKADAALEVRAAKLGRMSRSLAAAERQIDEETAELEFLEDLPNLLPQDKGYLRSQKVLAEDVRELRQKLSKRLKGGLYILIDAKANKLYLKNGFKLLWEADCSVGRGGTLVDKRTGRKWQFVTPRGEFRVIGKAKDPKWKKPDWAYVEAGEKKIPPPEDPSRLVEGELGAYVLNLGDGYLIHGTKNEAMLGRPASHGCVRLGADDLKRLYETVPEGTKVFIFD